MISQRTHMQGVIKEDMNLLPEINCLAGDFLYVHATEDVGEDDAHLVPGEVDADAGVLAGGEGVVGVGAVEESSVSFLLDMAGCDMAGRD
jgi:hypothetical protein